MFLRVNRDDIIEGLHKSHNIIPAKTGTTYLRTIWLQGKNDTLSISSTDSNLEFCGQYKAFIQQEGLVGVQGRALYDLIKKLPSGELIFTVENNSTLLIEQGSRKYKLPTSDVEWFQKFHDFPEEKSLFWSSDFLHEIIDRISYCVNDDESMEAISCLYMTNKEDNDEKSLEVCGLNGHQFAMYNFINDDIYNLLEGSPLLIQKKYLMELKKWLTSEEIELNISEKRLFFRTSDKTEMFSLPLSYYSYPNYYSFLNRLEEKNSVLEIDRVELLNALDRIAIFNTVNRCAYINFSSSEITLSGKGQEVGAGRENIPCTFTGELTRIAFPTKNLIEILGHFNSKKIRFTLSGTEDPCGITGDDDLSYQVILMPMMIQEENYNEIDS